MMQKESLIKLIEKLEKHNIKDIEKLLVKDERILTSLSLIEGNIFEDAVKIALANYKSYEDFQKALHIIIGIKSEDRGIINKILTNKELIERDLAINCAQIITESNKNKKVAYKYTREPNLLDKDNNTILKELELIIKSNTPINADFVLILLTYQHKYPKYIVTEGVKILQKANLNKLRNIYRVLTDDISIKYDIAIEGSNIIEKSNKKYIGSFAEYVLTSEYIVKKGIAIDIVKILNEYDTEEQCIDAMDIIDNINIINILDSDVILESIKLIKKSHRSINTSYLYDVLTNKKLIDNNLSILVGKKIISTTNEDALEAISELVDCNDVNTNLILDDCDLLIEIKDITKIKTVLNVLTNKYLNESGNALNCAKQILDIKKQDKVKFITSILLKDKEFASDKNIVEIIEEIKNSNASFTSFNTKPTTKNARIIEFGVMYINRSINPNMLQLECLMELMKKLSEEEIEIFINKFNTFLFRIKLIKLLSLKNIYEQEIIKFLEITTCTNCFKMMNNTFNTQTATIINQNNSDTKILLEIIKEDSSENIKADLLVKKLIKRKENNTK